MCVSVVDHTASSCVCLSLCVMSHVSMHVNTVLLLLNHDNATTAATATTAVVTVTVFVTAADVVAVLTV